MLGEGLVEVGQEVTGFTLYSHVRVRQSSSSEYASFCSLLVCLPVMYIL